ncbi:DUF389 domain-containing protein [Conexibacter woesei]|uniref:Hydrophobic domain protein n=1 Tax=Conexibacter woesei (strain DSM 14684 / CCUG 47730 / CIP 108061 / JCM 11494 / NBRC 100937 / ID131577) TaxID=469383 RepID=D3FBD9_CONWI|nr:DUF389 domain-containing protein [Conexibacter woesei]ADB49308.1 conserved hypothetical protein [Conexibacter woesei DSM 14684]
MLHLRVFGATSAIQEAAAQLGALAGVAHVTCSDAGTGSGSALLTADLRPDAADSVLGALDRLGVRHEDVWLLRLDGVQPGRQRRDAGTVVWADLLGQAGEHARVVARFLALMMVAGVIAAYGVIYDNGILIVGAMAVSPDFFPVAAACIGFVARRRRLVLRALRTLATGLLCTGLVACVLTAALDLLGLLPSDFTIDSGALSGLTTVNTSTVGVALVAGIAGMLSIETRASAAVGVAISVTTIPASAYLGVAAGVGEANKALGALAVLAINVAMLLVGGTLTLLVQAATARRAQRREQAPG